MHSDRQFRKGRSATFASRPFRLSRALAPRPDRVQLFVHAEGLSPGDEPGRFNGLTRREFASKDERGIHCRIRLGASGKKSEKARIDVLQAARALPIFTDHREMDCIAGRLLTSLGHTAIRRLERAHLHGDRPARSPGASSELYPAQRLRSFDLFVQSHNHPAGASL